MRTDQFRFGTPRKESNIRAMLMYAEKHNAPDFVVQAIWAGTAIKRRLYKNDWKNITKV